MPTDRRIEAVAAELAEKYEHLGYDVDEFAGPDEFEDAEEFYLYFSTGNSNLYLTFYTDTPAVSVAYPYTVARAVGRKISEDDRREIAEPDGTDEQNISSESVGESILEQTEEETLRELNFRLADHASSPLVGVEFNKTDTGAPTKFYSYSGILPYSDGFDLETLDARTDMVAITGANGNRFVRDALAVDTTGDPSEYAVELRF